MQHLRFMIAVVAILTLAACTDTESTGDARATAPAAPAAPTARTTAGSPRISFAKTIHDFGVIADAQDYYTSFRFTNTGTDTLVISSVKATCGCTVPTLAKTEYAPGESATISVTFDPSGKAGKQIQAITVLSNAKAQNVTKLAIQADVRPLIHFEFFLRFGAVALGQQHIRRIEVSYSDPDLQITGLRVNKPHLTVKLIDVGTPNPNTSGLPYLATIEVTLDAETAWGVLDLAMVKFNASGRAAEEFAPAADSYTVMVNGQVFGELQLDPIMLTAGEVIGRNRTFKLSAELTRTSGAPFSVTDIRISETTVSGLTPSVVAKGPGAYTVYLDGATLADGGPVHGRLAVSTDVPGEEELSIRFALFVE